MGQMSSAVIHRILGRVDDVFPAQAELIATIVMHKRGRRGFVIVWIRGS